MADNLIQQESKLSKSDHKHSGQAQNNLNFQRFALLVIMLSIGVGLFGVIKDTSVKQTKVFKQTSIATPKPQNSHVPTTLPPNPSSITVLVANGTSVPLAASNWSKYLSQKLGYMTLPAVDTVTPVSSSALYYEPGYSQAAQQLANTIGLSDSLIFGMPQTPPVSNLENAQLLLVLGPDLASKASSLP